MDQSSAEAKTLLLNPECVQVAATSRIRTKAPLTTVMSERLGGSGRRNIYTHTDRTERLSPQTGDELVKAEQTEKCKRNPPEAERNSLGVKTPGPPQQTSA